MAADLVLIAARVGRPGREQLEVECPFCGGQHYHGLGDGPRTSHCLRGERRTYTLRESPFAAGHLSLDVRTENEDATR